MIEFEHVGYTQNVKSIIICIPIKKLFNNFAISLIYNLSIDLTHPLFT